MLAVLPFLVTLLLIYLAGDNPLCYIDQFYKHFQKLMAL